MPVVARELLLKAHIAQWGTDRAAIWIIAGSPARFLSSTQMAYIRRSWLLVCLYLDCARFMASLFIPTRSAAVGRPVTE